MDSKEVISFHEFTIFDSIVNGTNRPHLSQNNDETRIWFIYEKLILFALDIAPEHHDKYNLILKDSHFIRYTDLLTHPGDKYSAEFLDNGGIIVKLPVKAKGIIDPIDIPPAAGVIQAYYLFLIELEFFRVSTSFNIILTDENWSVSDIENYSTRNLQFLKRLAEQLNYYSKQLNYVTIDISNKETSIYVTKVLKEYIIKSILLIQDIFEPYLRVKLLEENVIREKYFGQRLIHYPIQPSQLENYSNKRKLKEPLDNKTDNPRLRWYQLFKGQTEEKQKETAEKVLKILRDDNYITKDGSWQESPHQLMMIALYLVLKDHGYLVNIRYSAETLSEVFNKQFNILTESYKQWQPHRREKAKDYKDNFNRIPFYKEEL